MSDKNNQMKQESRAWAQRQAADALNQTMNYIAPIMLAGATILGLKAFFEPSKEEYVGTNYKLEEVQTAFTKSQGGSVEHTAGFAPTKEAFEDLVTSVAAKEGFNFCAEVTWKSGTFPIQFLDLVGDHWEETPRDPDMARTVEVTYADSTGSKAGGQIQYWSEDCDLVKNRLQSEVNKAFEGGNTSEPSHGMQSALEALIGPAVLRKTGTPYSLDSKNLAFYCGFCYDGFIKCRSAPAPRRVFYVRLLNVGHDYVGQHLKKPFYFNDRFATGMKIIVGQLGQHADFIGI